MSIPATQLQQWPADGLEPVPQCPCCGSPQRHLLHAGLVDIAFRAAPGQWTLYRCESCASAYLDPRPTPQTIGLAYQTYYTHVAGKDLRPAASPRGWRRLALALGNGYRNARYGSRFAPAHPLGALLLRLWPAARRRIDLGYCNRVVFC